MHTITTGTAGAIAGLAATVPMTVAMEIMHRQLPRTQQHPLPPHEITETIASEADLDELVGPEQWDPLTLINHFGYGTGTGALYGTIAHHIGLHPMLKGMGFGMAVWAGSYLGWLPLSGIMPPATEQPKERTMLMIAAHLVWGAALGTIAARLGAERPPGTGRPHEPVL